MELLYVLDEVKKGFSNKQRKIFGQINLLVGRDAAIGLISLQGVERTSQAEIKVIANLICQFTPLEIVVFNKSPRRVVLSGKFAKGHSVQIIPQYKVENLNTKAQPWAIDLVIELHRSIGSEFVKIAAIGVEYDGYPSHYIESKIKSTYQRDIGIVYKNGILPIRISPESWKKDPYIIKKAIKKYFEHQIKIIEEVQSRTMRAVKNCIAVNDDILTTCVVCNGRCTLAGDECPVCNGMGSIKRLVSERVDLSDYESFTCPSCRQASLDCFTCHGSGVISREKALEWS